MTTSFMPAIIPGFSGPLEIAMLAGIVLLLFGNRLPSVMRSLGRGVVEFKSGLSSQPSELDDATGDDSGTKSSSSD